ncbi:MAG: hypothetical protein Q9220_000672 [cf. Caloplaca sp. 1 TL-2023]
MAILLFKRSEFTDKASAQASSGWHKCMSKSVCKYPAIIAIILAILILLTLIYFAFRCLSCCCCDCLSGGRYQRKRKHHKYADLASTPYTGYQQPQQQTQLAPPQYAQFDHSSTHRGGAEDDRLPVMPMWGEGKEKRVYDDGREEEEEVKQPMLAAGAQGQQQQRYQEPAPVYAEVNAGDRGYRPYGAGYSQTMAYTPYSMHAWTGGEGKTVRDV